MPLDLVLHEGDAASLTRIRDDTVRPSFFKRHRTEHLEQRADIVTVDLPHSPTEGAPFVTQGIERDGLFRARALLQAVSVDDHDEIIQLVLRGSHSCFPVAAFLKLTVARE